MKIGRLEEARAVNFQFVMSQEEFFQILQYSTISVKESIDALTTARVRLCSVEELIIHVQRLEKWLEFLSLSEEFVQFYREGPHSRKTEFLVVARVMGDYQRWKRNALRRCKDKETKKWFKRIIFAKIDWSKKAEKIRLTIGK